QEGLVIHLEKNVPTKKDPSQAKRTDLFSLTEKGERYCMKIVDNLISALPEDKRIKHIKTLNIHSQKITALKTEGHHELVKKTESTFLSYSEYASRTEIKPIMKYKKFFGREDELKKLHTYIQNKKIIIIVGDSGIGKTRLSL